MTIDELKALAEVQKWLRTGERDDPPVVEIEATVLALIADRDYLNETNNGLLDLANERQNRIAVLEAKLAEAEGRAEDHHTEIDCAVCMELRAEKAAAEAKLANALAVLPSNYGALKTQLAETNDIALHWHGQFEAAKSNEKALREALVKYGRHGGLCVYWQPGCHLKCDCGLAAALAAGKEGA